MTLTRDGISLWLAAVVAAAAFLMSVGTPPTEWGYQQWLQTISAAALWGTGKLQSSPRPSTKEVERGIRDSGKPV